MAVADSLSGLVVVRQSLSYLVRKRGRFERAREYTSPSTGVTHDGDGYGMAWVWLG
jgi:hypothetical protein